VARRHEFRESRETNCNGRDQGDRPHYDGHHSVGFEHGISGQGGRIVAARWVSSMLAYSVTALAVPVPSTARPATVTLSTHAFHLATPRPRRRGRHPRHRRAA